MHRIKCRMLFVFMQLSFQDLGGGQIGPSRQKLNLPEPARNRVQQFSLELQAIHRAIPYHLEAAVVVKLSCTEKPKEELIIHPRVQFSIICKTTRSIHLNLPHKK